MFPWGQSGYVVEGFAPSPKAAGALLSARVEASFFTASHARKKQTRHHPGIMHLLQRSARTYGIVLVHRARTNAGLRTAQLDQIMRQKAPELLKAVQQLATGEVKAGIKMLADQERITEIQNPKDRVAAIAKDYAASPENTIVISPDNRSRQQINEAVRAELLAKGALAQDSQQFKTLTHRNDMTGADRTWAARYDVGDVLQYTRGSKGEGLAKDSFATVREVDARANTITVKRADGQTVTYDPRRVRGVNAYKETTRKFATGDRVQFTAQDRELKIANRDMGTISKIEDGKVTVTLDTKDRRSVTLEGDRIRGLDHGYAVTSHSSQGLTAGRVIANMDTDSSRSLINTRLAYVTISRAQTDARIYTNDAANLGQRLSTDISKTAALDFRPPAQPEQARETKEAPKKEAPRPERTAYEYATPDDRLKSVARDYTTQKDRAVVLAPDPTERRELPSSSVQSFRARDS